VTFTPLILVGSRGLQPARKGNTDGQRHHRALSTSAAITPPGSRVAPDLGGRKSIVTEVQATAAATHIVANLRTNEGFDHLG
jgi:hypothetical protein